MIDAVIGICWESFLLLARMAPYLLLGVAFAGALHVALPVGFIARHLGGAGFGAVMRAAILGVPLPICSCGVVPVAASLKKSGASDGATVSFLVTTPTTGVDSMLATYSLLGPAFTVARVAASVLIGLVAGLAVALGLRRPAADPKETPSRTIEPAVEEPGGKLSRGVSYALGELLAGIARPMVVGTVLGGAIAYLLPAGLIEQYVGHGLLSYLVMLGVGIPLYVCASGSIPLAAALLAKGRSPGAALVFLIAGPATNVATVTVVSEMLGKKVLAIYLATLALGSLASGLATDTLFAHLASWVPAAHAAAHHHESLSLLEIVSGGLLGVLLGYHLLYKPLAARLRAGAMEDDAMLLFKVPDMNCAHCAGTITGAVSPLPGIVSVDADPETKLLRLETADDADAGAVRKAIEEAGFHPEESD